MVEGGGEEQIFLEHLPGQLDGVHSARGHWSAQREVPAAEEHQEGQVLAPQDDTHQHGRECQRHLRKVRVQRGNRVGLVHL